MASSDVFISYSSQDKAVADAVCGFLESRGLACWIAPRDVTPGEFYAESIVHAIDSARVAVLVLSQHAADSQHVLREVERASSKRHPVVSLRIDHAPLPAGLEYFLNTSQWLDASTTGVDRALPRLVDAVRSALAQPPAATHVDPGPSVTRRTIQPGRRMLVALVAVIATAVVYFVFDRFWLSNHNAAQQQIAATAVTSASTPSAVAAPEKSIAVLPFVDMSEKHDQEYFSDGLSEELLDLLTKIPQLHVAARTSSFYYKGKEVKLAEIARELHVAHLLEGSVRKSGNRVRITAQLIRTADGYHQWSQTYDRMPKDIFAVQEEIATAVVRQLQLTLLGRSPTVEKTDPKAYALSLQARQLGRQFTREGLEQSIALYRQALAIDPNYAVAWVGVARSYCIEADVDLRPVDEAFRLAREATNKALAIAPDYAPAHASLGRIAMNYDADLPAAARHYEYALAQEPANLDIIGDAGDLAFRLGRLDQAVALDEYAVTRDPVNPDDYDGLGLAYVRIGRLDDAIASWRTALRLNPGRIAVQMHIGWALLLKGDGRAALAAMQQESLEFTRLIGLVMAHHTLGNRAASAAALTELIGKYGKGGEYNVAYVLAWRGDTDRAFEWLMKAVAYRISSHVYADRLGFANLRDDPRWLPLLHKIGQAPEQLAAIKFDVTLSK